MARKTIYEKLADKLLKEKGVVIENVRRAGAAFQKKTPGTWSWTAWCRRYDGREVSMSIGSHMSASDLLGCKTIEIRHNSLLNDLNVYGRD